MRGGYTPPRSCFPRAEYDRRRAKAKSLEKASRLVRLMRYVSLANELDEIAHDYAVPPRSAMARDSPMFRPAPPPPPPPRHPTEFEYAGRAVERYCSEPDVRLPSMVPGIPREPWTATVERTGRWSYRLHVGSRGFRFTVDDADPFALGSRAHAERKAKRLVDRQNRRDWLAEREGEGGTIIR